MRVLLYLLIPISFFNVSYSQKDSSDIMDQNGDVRAAVSAGLLGRKQTGTLNSFNLSPSLQIDLSGSKWAIRHRTTYQLMKVENLTFSDDLWIFNSFTFLRNRRIFPFVAHYQGYAKSYKIDHSLVTGLGLGLNLFSENKKIDFTPRGFVGVANVKFSNDLTINSPAIGSNLLARAVVNEPWILTWEFHSFHGIQEKGFNGVSNLVQMLLPVNKILMLTVSHQTIYNSQVGEDIARTNTVLLFGLNLKFSK